MGVRSRWADGITEWWRSVTASWRQVAVVLTLVRGKKWRKGKISHRPVALLDGSLKSATDAGVEPESVMRGARRSPLLRVADG
jgi:hypothetical protein